MTEPNPLDAIKARQRSWAERHGIACDHDGYCGCVDDNVLGRVLSTAAREDLRGGDGTELGTADRRGKLQALHSSSALACNWFDYWRGRDLTILSRAFGAPVPFVSLALEQKRPTGLGGTPPNLDVIFTCTDDSVFAVESKFGEPYRKSKTKTILSETYFAGGRKLWTDAGLPGCQAVADALRSRQHRFRVLDVAQLLKHMLGLAHGGKPWHLCSLWFEQPGAVAKQHRAELVEFARLLGVNAERFSAFTYQELFERMLPLLPPEHTAYADYLRDRYL